MSFQLPDLNYGFDSLEPHIDAKTMQIHHGKHHAGYTSKLNAAVEGTDLEGKSIEDLLSNLDLSNSAVRNNGGGYYNHCLFWEIMSPNGGGSPSGNLLAAIEKALTENPDLRKDSVAVVFFKDKGLKKSQQMFADLNRHAIRPSNSIARLYDHRDPVAEIIRRVVYETEVFKGVVEMERSNISERSSKLFPFSGIYSASKHLIEENNWKDRTTIQLNLKDLK